ncbi:hypothetical protein BH23CHL2_BH23CHL2_11120 [soil metagenome]
MIALIGPHQMKIGIRRRPSTLNTMRAAYRADGTRCFDIFEAIGEQTLDNQMAGNPQTPITKPSHGGLLDREWPCARIGYYAFETDAFYSDCFC